MSAEDRRAALVGRFRASALERVGKIALAVMEFEDGRGDVEAVRSVARELHTIKGESRMLRFAAMSDLAHAAEAVLLAGGDGVRPPPAHCTAIGRSMEQLARALGGEGSEGDATLVQAATTLRALLSETASAAPPAETAARAPEPKSAAATLPPSEAAHVATSPAATPTSEATGAPRQRKERWVQVNATRVDDLCDGLTDFMGDFRALATRLRAAKIPGEAGRVLLDDFDRCRAQLDALGDATWSLRLVPVEPALNDLAQHARALAVEQGKQLRLIVDGGAAQVERNVLDTLWEPLVHLVRNAVDHGVERPEDRGDKPREAKLTLRAEPVGATVVLTVEDDGAGVNVERVRAVAVARGLLGDEAAAALGEREAMDLLFMHGFSTRAEVSDVSGRGVGLDVVRGVVESLGGIVTLESRLGRGAKMSLSVPVAIGTERVLVFECGAGLYGLPSRQVREVVPLVGDSVLAVAGGRALKHGEETLPLRSLSAALGVAGGTETRAIIIDSGRRWAMAIPRMLGEYELVRRPADAAVASFGHISASMLLDDGRLVLLLAPGALLKRSEHRAITPAAVARRKRVLVVDDSAIVRDLVGQIIIGAGYELSTSVDGVDALQAIHAAPPDLVLADVDMPRMDGFELLTQVRRHHPTLPVVMHTTRGSTEDRRRAATLGADGYVSKSEFAEAALIATVRRCLGEPT